MHRDIKPANLIVSSDGAVKIMDFGVARNLDSEEQLTLTREVIGTLMYLPPDQWHITKSDAPVDGRIDIYALGVTAYELAVGQSPFAHKAADHGVLYQAKQRTEIPSLAAWSATIPEWFEEFVIIAASANPKKRFQTAEDALAFLEENLAAPEEGSDSRGTVILNLNELGVRPARPTWVVTPLVVLLALSLVLAAGVAAVIFNFVW